MPVDPKDFAKHKLVVAHQILKEKSVDGAIQYVDGVQDAVKPLLTDAPELQQKLDDLEVFLGVFRAAAELAEKEDLTIGEYVKTFTKK